MLIFLSLMFFIPSSDVIASHKPPLQIINTDILPIEQLDTILKIRLWTIIDTLNVALEDIALTQEQQEQLKSFNDQQDEIVNSYKTFYQMMIEEQKKIEFNRSKIINGTIEDYRKKVQDKINTGFNQPVIEFYQRIKSSLLRPTTVQAPDTATNEFRRRQRSESNDSTASDETIQDE